MDLKLIIQIVIICFLTFLALFFIKKVFKRNQDKIYLKFTKSFLQVFVCIVAAICVLNNFEGFQTFSATILTSSSLLVVVLGFAFQSSLTDFIAGIFISFFKPFDINDRITLKQQNISGTIEDITIRHTVIKTFTNSRLIIPNSIMNQAIVENNHMTDARSINFMDVLVDYDTDIDKAKEIIKDCIESHPDTINLNGNEDKDYTYVFIRELGDNGVSLRANVCTETVDINFKTCSEIRESILKKFKENNIKIPYNYMEVIHSKKGA
jgi:small-conductance mechanosensitive channel